MVYKSKITRYTNIIGSFSVSNQKVFSKLAISLELKETNYEAFRFEITYPRYARIIVQSKDVDIHALIGNIGGYVGLFLGTYISLIYTVNCFVIVSSRTQI